MSNVMETLTEVMSVMEVSAENGECACLAFGHVCGLEDFESANLHLITILEGIAAYSRPEALRSNAGHFLTAVMAIGYALGASESFDAMSQEGLVTVPESLASKDYLEAWGTPESEDYWSVIPEDS